MINNLSVIVVVLFRIAAVVMVLSALYRSLAAAVVALLFSEGGATTGFLAVPGLVISICAGVVLWLLAKPIARAVTANL